MKGFNYRTTYRSGAQNILEDIIRRLYPTYTITANKTFDWLKTKEGGRHLEIDIWIEELQMAIEYNGIQHYEPSSHLNGSDAAIKYNQQVWCDNKKKELIDNHPEYVKYFLVIPYTTKLTRNNIIQAISNTLKS